MDVVSVAVFSEEIPSIYTKTSVAACMIKRAIRIMLLTTKYLHFADDVSGGVLSVFAHCHFLLI